MITLLKLLLIPSLRLYLLCFFFSLTVLFLLDYRQLFKKHIVFSVNEINMKKISAATLVLTENIDVDTNYYSRYHIDVGETIKMLKNIFVMKFAGSRILH